ncbi:MAG: methyltransferase type 11 [uncultured bacterium]|nr:MAG: methyltransferase type 11 [uncultured bacterium]
MFFLSKEEAQDWRLKASQIVCEKTAPEAGLVTMNPEFRHYFAYFIGILLCAKGQIEHGKAWLRSGAHDETIPGNSYLLDYIERHNNTLSMPQVTFSDPRPFVHFTNVPQIKAARDRFVEHSIESLPRFTHPVKVMDIGCGSGALLIQLLQGLVRAKKIAGVEEILFIDPSEKMLGLATQNSKQSFPNVKIVTEQKRIEDVECSDATHDIALAALAWHHMPFETKLIHIKKWGGHVRNFLLFELEANHDTPEQFSPELAVSMYQAFGGGAALVLAHDAPKEVQQMSVDYFLMTEAISLMTQPRGLRSDYHMLRSQWHELFAQTLGERFKCQNEETCYSDGKVEFYGLHYGS